MHTIITIVLPLFRLTASRETFSWKNSTFQSRVRDVRRILVRATTHENSSLEFQNLHVQSQSPPFQNFQRIKFCRVSPGVKRRFHEL